MPKLHLWEKLLRRLLPQRLCNLLSILQDRRFQVFPHSKYATRRRKETTIVLNDHRGVLRRHFHSLTW